MSRRDLIIVAVLTNIGLLAILFMMAINAEDEGYREKPLVEDAAIAEAKPIEIKMEEKVFLAQSSDVDEVDNLLKVFAQSSSADFEKSYPVHDEPVKLYEKPKLVTTSASDNDNAFIDVTVKKGDVLSKIAALNGTTVSQIKKLNNLATDQLKVGQTLKVPKSPLAVKTLSDVTLTRGEFYEIQSGDNPWNIAKKFNISVSDLLKMNDMDEKKAKNLKIGQKIRVE